MPSSLTYKRNYEQEYKGYHSKSPQKKARALRNAARAELIKEGRVMKKDGKDVDHKKPLSKGGSNMRSNLRVMDKEKNRSFKRDKKGKMK